MVAGMEAEIFKPDEEVKRLAGRWSNEPDTTGKPSTSAMHVTADGLALEIAEVGVVGDDATAEMQMTRQCGAIGTGVTSGAVSAGEWDIQSPDKSPHLVIDNIGELISKPGLR